MASLAFNATVGNNVIQQTASDRCRIRLNRLQREDPELLRACHESGVQYKDLDLPRKLTLWREERTMLSQWPVILQVIYPAASLWSPPVPKQEKMGPGKAHNGLPCPPHYGFRPQGRTTQPFRHNGWALPGQRGGHGYWGGTPGQAYC
uniref:Anti-proliferative protein domain-containing protein n=1 Tax=Oncorhynchus mykiss TaxID=8022 RepID=A0A8K9XTS9_ONCMY